MVHPGLSTRYLRKTLLLLNTLLSLAGCTRGGPSERDALEAENDSLRSVLAGLNAEENGTGPAYHIIVPMALDSMDGGPFSGQGPGSSGPVLDRTERHDTIPLPDGRPAFAFVREVTVRDWPNGVLANTLGAVQSMYRVPGIKAFSICEGEALPGALGRCSEALYVVFDLDDEDVNHRMVKIAPFYRVEIRSIRPASNPADPDGPGDYVMEFEHGMQPRTTERLSLLDMKFLDP